MPRGVQCNFIDGLVQCLNRARLHYMWQDGTTSNACFMHANQVEDRYSYVDKHDIESGCAVTGGVWRNSLVEPPGRCDPPGNAPTKFDPRAMRQPVGTLQT